MHRLTLRLLGSAEILLDGEPVRNLYAHAAGLLIFLATERSRSHSRDTLANLLWPDEPPEVARHNLRQAVWRLRESLGDRGSDAPFVAADRSSVGLRRDAGVWCDAESFAAICEDPRLPSGERLDARGLGWLTEAAELYRGEFLQDFFVPASETFESWLIIQRQRLHRQAVGALERLCLHHEEAGQPELASRYARRLVEADPGEEKGHLYLMRLLAASGQVQAALAQYQALEGHLWNNLRAAPTAEARRFYDWLRQKPDKEPAVGPRHERRRVTVLQYGLVTQPDAAPDPEDLWRWRDALWRQAEDAGRRFNALAAPTGSMDITLRFGYPSAQPDDAVRAVEAALELRAWADRELPEGTGLAAGIASGAVAVYEAAGAEPDIAGEPDLLAARLRHLVPGFGILLAEGSFRQVAPHFVCRRLLDPGQAGAPAAYHVEGRTTGEPPVQADVPLVGRQLELDALLRAWDQVLLGRGKVVLMSGESGVGKSRLLRALNEQLEQEGVRVLRVRCAATAEATALEPFLRLLREYCGLLPGDAVADQQGKLDRAMRRFRFQAQERALLATMLDVGDGGQRGAGLALESRQRTMRLILRMVRALAREPVILSIEDIHWLDPSSTELLVQLVKETERLPVLLIMTTQSACAAPWLQRRELLHLPLGPLSEAAARELVATVAGRRLDEELTEQVLARASRIPLYLKEMTRAVAEEGACASALPGTLQDALLVRFDRLREAGRLARLAAVIGSEFDLESLSCLAERSEQSLLPLLARLTTASIIEPPTEAGTYSFCHGLVREFAYAGLLRRERRELHARVAAHLAQRAARGEAVGPEVLARHYRAAGDNEQALNYYYRAGVKALSRSAFAESVSHLNEALAMLAATPAGPARDAMEVRLRVVLGLPLVLIEESHRETQHSFDRLEGLLDRVTDPALLIPALRVVGVYQMARAAFDRAQPLLERFLGLSLEVGDAVRVADAQVLKGMALLFRGHHSQARALIEQGVAQVPETTVQELIRYGSDPDAAGHSCLALAAWAQGRPEQARTLTVQALGRARHLGHPVSFVWTANMALLVLYLLGETDHALDVSLEALNVCHARNIGGSWAYWARVVQQRILAEQTHDVDYLLQLLDSRKRINGTAADTTQPFPDLLAAEACQLFGEYDRGLRILETALDGLERLGGHLLAPELYRLHAELLATDPARAGQARPALQQAVRLAGEQDCPALELRAGLSLARLEQTDPAGAGVRVLRRAVAAFAPEAAFPDLSRARALLALIANRSPAPGHRTIDPGVATR